jgi:hypothetical protein
MMLRNPAFDIRVWFNSFMKPTEEAWARR